MAHGRYRYEALDPANGVQKGTCHVLFADGEIALLDTDSDFGAVESVDAISGIRVESPLLSKSSSLRFDLNGMAIKLKDTSVATWVSGSQQALLRCSPGPCR